MAGRILRDVVHSVVPDPKNKGRNPRRCRGEATSRLVSWRTVGNDDKNGDRILISEVCIGASHGFVQRRTPDR